MFTFIIRPSSPLRGFDSSRFQHFVVEYYFLLDCCGFSKASWLTTVIMCRFFPNVSHYSFSFDFCCKDNTNIDILMCAMVVVVHLR